jgi:hypothetical protein
MAPLAVSEETRRAERALLRWLLSPGFTAPAERLPEAAAMPGIRAARLAGAHLLGRMTAPLAAVTLETTIARWLTAGRDALERQLLWLGAWIGAQALRRYASGALYRELSYELGSERVLLALRRGLSCDVPDPDARVGVRRRVSGLGAVHDRLRNVSPGLAERFLLDQPLARVGSMEAEAWVRGREECRAAVSDVALWNRHERAF